jgi:(2Fe-2S) ferredoxin
MKKKTILSGIILIVTIICIAATMLYVVLEQQKLKNRLYEPTDMNNVVITLTRSRCLGVCPIYNVTIYGNGTVLYEGIANVNSTGIQRSNISENQVRQLLSEFKKIDYFSLNETDIASHVVYDAPLFTTSLSINGKTKTIHHYETADPQALTELENKIDEIVNSGQWIQ